MRVFKYGLAITDRQIIRMPYGAKILSVQLQKKYGTNQSHLQLWAEVDEGKESTERRFAIFGTGHEIPSGKDFRYLSTVVSESGQLVWHIYEEVPPVKSDKPQSEESGQY